MVYFKTAGSILLALLLLTGCSPAPPAARQTGGHSYQYEYTGVALSKSNAEESSEPGMLVAARNDSLELYAAAEGSRAGQFCVKSLRSGEKWYSNPVDLDQDNSVKGSPRFEMYSQLLVFGYDEDMSNERTANSYIGTGKGESVTLTKIDNGFSARYEFTEDRFSVVLNVVLEQDRVVVSCPAEEIKEEGAFRVLRLAVTPYMGAGSATDEGYMVVPDGSGALIRFNNGKDSAQPYSAQVYGEDISLSRETSPGYTQKVSLPVFGISRNGAGLLGVIESGDASARINAYVAGMRNSRNNVYADFLLRSRDTVVVGESGYSQTKESIRYDMEHFSDKYYAVAFYPLAEKEHTYSDLAHAYRGILKAQGAGAERFAQLALYLEAAGGVVKQKTSFGITHKSFEVLTSVTDMLDMKQELQSSGVSRVTLLYTQWSRQQAALKMQNSVSLHPRLGKLKAIKEEDVFLSYSPFAAQKSGNGFGRFFDTAKRLSKEPVLLYSYKPSTLIRDTERGAYYLPGSEPLFRLMSGYFKSLNQYPRLNLYLKDAGTILYTDYDSKSYASRADMKNSIVSALGQYNGKTALFEPSAYTLPYADQAVSVPTGSSGYTILDEDIPFVQMVYNGLIPYTSEALNLHDSPEKQFLKCIETGADPYFVWVKGDAAELKETRLNDLYGADYERWKDWAVQKYRELAAVYNQIGSRNIAEHRLLGDNVAMTTFENGKSVTVDYGTLTYSIS